MECTYEVSTDYMPKEWHKCLAVALSHDHVKVKASLPGIDKTRKGKLELVDEGTLIIEQIEEYSKLIAGERYIYNTERTLHFYITDVVDSLKSYLDKNGGITTGQLLNAFSNFPVEAKQFLNNRFVAKQVQNIDREIETAQNERRKSPSAATDTGKKLVNNTKADIDFLRNVLGENDFQFHSNSNCVALPS